MILPDLHHASSPDALTILLILCQRLQSGPWFSSFFLWLGKNSTRLNPDFHVLQDTTFLCFSVYFPDHPLILCWFLFSYPCLNERDAHSMYTLLSFSVHASLLISCHLGFKYHLYSDVCLHLRSLSWFAHLVTYSAFPLGCCAGSFPNDSQPRIYSLKFFSLMLALLGFWKLYFPRSACHWRPLRLSQIECWERIGTVTCLYFSCSVGNSVVDADSVLDLKGLPLSFSFQSSEFSPKPEDPLSLHTAPAQKFRKLTPLQKTLNQWDWLNTSSFLPSRGWFWEKFWVLLIK